MSWMWPDAAMRLQGGGLRLERLTLDHIACLEEASATASDWEWENGFVPRPGDIPAYVNRAVWEFRKGQSFPFAVCLESGKAIGASWYRVFDSWRKKVEIGFTWYHKSHRRTFVNAQAKFLLMSCAFETLGCILVEFLVHEKNAPSRAAMAALGAHQDGFLRRVVPMKDGTFADVVVFSVSDSEWPSVKGALLKRLSGVTR